jgi:hypothetical protein
MFNVVRVGSAGLLGVGSGVLDGAVTGGPITSVPQITWGAVAEGVGLLAGAGLQLLSPATLPNLADGLVDGSVALLLRRGGEYAATALKTPAPAGAYVGAWQYNMPLGQTASQINGAVAGARYGGVHNASTMGVGGFARGQSTFSGIIPNRVT